MDSLFCGENAAQWRTSTAPRCVEALVATLLFGRGRLIRSCSYRRHNVWACLYAQYKKDPRTGQIVGLFGIFDGAAAGFGLCVLCCSWVPFVNQCMQACAKSLCCAARPRLVLFRPRWTQRCRLCAHQPVCQHDAKVTRQAGTDGPPASGVHGMQKGGFYTWPTRCKGCVSIDFSHLST